MGDLFSNVTSWFGWAVDTGKEAVGKVKEVAEGVAETGAEAVGKAAEFAATGIEALKEGIGAVASAGAKLTEGLTKTAVSEARDYLTGLVSKIADPVYRKASISPLDFAESGIDFSADQMSVLKDTAASFYQLMIVLGAGGMVLSIMIGSVMIGLNGERVRHEVISSLFAKTVVIMSLLSFVSVFGMYGAIANEIAASIN